MQSTIRLVHILISGPWTSHVLLLGPRIPYVHCACLYPLRRHGVDQRRGRDAEYHQVSTHSYYWALD